jgi:hypothetical protein
MENYISTNFYQRKIEVFCGNDAGTFSGIVAKVIDGVLMLEDIGKTNHISIDKIISFRSLD